MRISQKNHNLSLTYDIVRVIVDYVYESISMYVRPLNIVVQCILHQYNIVLMSACDMHMVYVLFSMQLIIL